MGSRSREISRSPAKFQFKLEFWWFLDFVRDGRVLHLSKNIDTGHSQCISDWNLVFSTRKRSLVFVVGSLQFENKGLQNIFRKSKPFCQYPRKPKKIWGAVILIWEKVTFTFSARTSLRFGTWFERGTIFFLEKLSVVDLIFFGAFFSMVSEREKRNYSKLFTQLGAEANLRNIEKAGKEISRPTSHTTNG